MDLIVIIYLSWGLVVGVVFSTIGAAGGILASFGLITLFGVTEPNSVKPMAQIAVMAATLTFFPGYLRRSALVLPLGLLLGVGGLLGAYVGSTVSSRYLSDMTTFRPLFGALTLVISAQILWKLYQTRRSSDVGNATEAPRADGVVTKTSVSARMLSFTYGEIHYEIVPWSPLLAGLVISVAASIFGVGGGFLLVPYMAVMLGLPMHIIPATAAIAIFMSLTVSISNFIALGAPIQFDILIPLVIGTVLGAIVGPHVNRALSNTWLQLIMGVIVAGIGLKYTVF